MDVEHFEGEPLAFEEPLLGGGLFHGAAAQVALPRDPGQGRGLGEVDLLV